MTRSRTVLRAVLCSVLLLFITALAIELATPPPVPPSAAATYASANPEPAHILNRIRWWVKRHRAAFAGADG